MNMLKFFYQFNYLYFKRYNLIMDKKLISRRSFVNKASKGSALIALEEFFLCLALKVMAGL